MAILSTIVKDFIRQKTESGYITLKPKTDADCVSYINSDAVETDVQTELDELNNYLYFSIGDTERCVFWGGAMFTGGNKSIVFSIVTTKDMSDISEITVTSPEINIRQGGSYLAGSASSNSTSGFSVSCEKVNSKTLKITVVFASSVGGTNNDAVGLYFRGDLNFS